LVSGVIGKSTRREFFFDISGKPLKIPALHPESMTKQNQHKGLVFRAGFR
jgi:hypothetical protein